MSDFLSRPIWQQYLIIMMLSVTVVLIGYFLFIQDIKQQIEQQANLYHEKIAEIELLESKLRRYQASKESLLSFISENELALAFESNRLKLISFKRYQAESTVNWDIQLHGQFADFISLISSFDDNYYYLDFQNLKITNQETYLQITFTLSFKEELE